MFNKKRDGVNKEQKIPVLGLTDEDYSKSKTPLPVIESKTEPPFRTLYTRFGANVQNDMDNIYTLLYKFLRIKFSSELELNINDYNTSNKSADSIYLKKRLYCNFRTSFNSIKISKHCFVDLLSEQDTISGYLYTGVKYKEPIFDSSRPMHTLLTETLTKFSLDSIGVIDLFDLALYINYSKDISEHTNVISFFKNDTSERNELFSKIVSRLIYCIKLNETYNLPEETVKSIYQYMGYLTVYDCLNFIPYQEQMTATFPFRSSIHLNKQNINIIDHTLKSLYFLIENRCTKVRLKDVLIVLDKIKDNLDTTLKDIKSSETMLKENLESLEDLGCSNIINEIEQMKG